MGVRFSGYLASPLLANTGGAGFIQLGALLTMLSDLFMRTFRAIDAMRLVNGKICKIYKL
jgi:hypothetical protein